MNFTFSSDIPSASCVLLFLDDNSLSTLHSKFPDCRQYTNSTQYSPKVAREVLWAGRRCWRWSIPWLHPLLCSRSSLSGSRWTRPSCCLGCGNLGLSRCVSQGAPYSTALVFQLFIFWPTWHTQVEFTPAFGAAGLLMAPSEVFWLSQLIRHVSPMPKPWRCWCCHYWDCQGCPRSCRPSSLACFLGWSSCYCCCT